ncbi:conserved oligomeric Golgi complex subunit 1-like [Pomacea canaliculata]|uniref:conserved oligomeric Golgi complex subunit 1-like n=1 Tax=Pomacea canaliculata TaxID=400727 RepID=UPI000D73C67B|nr:conserved oligomeric Golgi complex subunit 1-like [Pomacea canaliculata]
MTNMGGYSYVDCQLPLDMANMASNRQYPGLLKGDMLDTNSLFEKHTIEEIRNTEKKTRAEIEKKKEDLRMMVGERYRDLIEAADTITAMKTSVENVMKSITHMEELCQNLHQKHMIKGASYQQPMKSDNSRKQQEANFFGVAAQIKFLLDMPEKIWSSVESGDYLASTQLYLLARHVNTSLHLDSQHSAKVLSWFPVLTRQWAAISHFRSTILQGCRTLLTDTEATYSDEKMAQILCSVLLLDDSNPRQVFNEFLLARTKALQQTLHWGQQANVKDQVCGVIRLLKSTIRQIHAVFYNPGSGTSPQEGDSYNLLQKTLASVVNTDALSQFFGLDDVQGSLSMKYVPKSVKDFRPALRTPAMSISVETLQGNCQQWINTCLQDVQAGVTKLLNYVSSVKRLADIRDDVWNILSEEGNTEHWDVMCRRVVNKPLHLWQEFLQPLFLNRVKALIQCQLDSTAEMTKRSMSKIMMEMASSVKTSQMIYEEDLGQFLWSEGAGDVQMNFVWQPAASRCITDSGGLAYKARAFTPAVQRLCQSVDGKLKAMLEDNQLYVQPSEDTSKEPSTAGPFDRYSDAQDILRFCQDASASCIQQIVDYLMEQLSLWETALRDIPDATTQIITEHKILFVARTCGALSELTPHLQKCFLGVTEHQRNETGIRKSRSMQKSPGSQEWQAVVQKMEQCRAKSYKIWIDHTVNSITKTFTEEVTSTHHNSVIEKSTRWEDVDIMEETEEGRKLSSKIHVPMQASWHVHSTLFHLCQQLNRVGSHAFPRSVVREILLKILQGMLMAYEKLLTVRKKGSKSELPLSQQAALQTLFNVKYIMSMIPWRDDSEASKVWQQRCQVIVEGLEEHVDPFDLDVFSPYMQANLMKATQRSAVLLGNLSMLDKHAITGSGRPPIGGQEQHNILPLTTCSARFPLLPLGSQPSRPSLQQTVLSQTISRSIESLGANTLTSVVEATLPKTSSQSDLSSSFYDKLDRLGSMGSRLFSNIGGKS